MNNLNQTVINIKKDILHYSKCSSLIGQFESSDFAKRMYAFHKLNVLPCFTVLCIALSKNGGYLDEIHLNREQSYNPYIFVSHLYKLSSDNGKSDLMIAVRNDRYYNDAHKEKFTRQIESVRRMLKENSIDLKHVFLINDDETRLPLDGHSYI